MKVPDGKRNKHIILVSSEGEPTNTLQRLIYRDAGNKPEMEWRAKYGYHVDKELTDQIVTTFNINTKMYADNSVYESSKGLYIKKEGRRFYLSDFK